MAECQAFLLNLGGCKDGDLHQQEYLKCDNCSVPS